VERLPRDQRTTRKKKGRERRDPKACWFSSYTSLSTVKKDVAHDVFFFDLFDAHLAATVCYSVESKQKMSIKKQIIPSNL